MSAFSTYFVHLATLAKCEELNAYNAPLTTHFMMTMVTGECGFKWKNPFQRIKLHICTHTNYSLFYNDAIIITIFLLKMLKSVMCIMIIYSHVFQLPSIKCQRSNIKKLKPFRHSNAMVGFQTSFSACRKYITKKKCLNFIPKINLMHF